MGKLKQQVLEPLLENSNYNVDLYHTNKADIVTGRKLYQNQVKTNKNKKA